MMPAGKTIRLATYNVHACIGPDGRHDPGRIAAVIGELNADIVALQEFSYPVDIALETRSPVVLTALDDYQSALGPTRKSSTTHWFGNVILTRHPIRDVQRVDLSVERREPRGALAATIDIGGHEVHALAAHLGLKLHERRFQVAQIVRHLEKARTGLVAVLGDFNDWLPGRSVVHVLDKWLGRTPRRRSFPVACPVLPLDRIWIRPCSAIQRIYVHRSPLSRRASDHLPVVADVQLLPDRPAARRWNEVVNGEVRKVRVETGSLGDAPEEEGHAQERLGPEGDEPQTGDRDRPERSAREGRKGSAPEETLSR
jgi:endonuclease/exonuclease/phosphatase family metal-dependent hydrolase